MERYSFPYQRGLHNRLTRTTLKPVMIICVVVVLALPFVLTGVLTVQANRNSAKRFGWYPKLFTAIRQQKTRLVPEAPAG